MTDKARIRVLLADDHKIIRDSLKHLLNCEPDIEVIAEADNGRDTIRLANQFMPDIVIMDISMPDVNGIQATEQIITANPSVKILPLSMHTDQRFVADILRAGAKGYLPKDSAAEELVRAIRVINGGKMYLSPVIVKFVAAGFVENRNPEKGAGARDLLSLRELEVLQLLTEGHSTKEIAFKLSVSSKTIESHRKNIFTKLGIDNIADLTKYAIREGVTPLE